MRSLSASLIRDTVAELCIKANSALPTDVEEALNAAAENEPWPLRRAALSF